MLNGEKQIEQLEAKLSEATDSRERTATLQIQVEAERAAVEKMLEQIDPQANGSVEYAARGVIE